MDLQIKDDGTHTFNVVLKDKFGNATTADGALTATSSDETVVTATLSADGSQVTIAAAGAGKLGTATVTVSDAADNLSGVANVTVVAGTPVSIELDEPQTQEAGAASTDAQSDASTQSAPQSAPTDATVDAAAGA